ncbi:hypothetical protein NL526_28250, partial [Klebsiella pneumoniae]|nr:hypothetical protein [Klebsiella pneumoniae]
PAPILRKLGLVPAQPDRPVPLARAIARPAQADPVPPAQKPPSEAERRMAASLSMQPKDAAEIHDLFFRATASERAAILHSLDDTPLKA